MNDDVIQAHDDMTEHPIEQIRQQKPFCFFQEKRFQFILLFKKHSAKKEKYTNLEYYFFMLP